jgi:hypothetical protein
MERRDYEKLKIKNKQDEIKIESEMEEEEMNKMEELSMIEKAKIRFSDFTNFFFEKAKETYNLLFDDEEYQIKEKLNNRIKNISKKENPKIKNLKRKIIEIEEDNNINEEILKKRKKVDKNVKYDIIFEDLSNISFDHELKKEVKKNFFSDYLQNLNNSTNEIIKNNNFKLDNLDDSSYTTTPTKKKVSHASEKIKNRVPTPSVIRKKRNVDLESLNFKTPIKLPNFEEFNFTPIKRKKKSVTWKDTSQNGKWSIIKDLEDNDNLLIEENLKKSPLRLDVHYNLKPILKKSNDSKIKKLPKF